MANPIQLIKSHPIATVSAVAGVFLLVMLVSSSGGSASGQQVVSGSSGAPDNSFATMQAQLSAQAMQVGAQRDVQLAGQQTAIQLATIDAQTKAAQIAAGLVLGEDQLQNQAQQSTLAAQVQGEQIKAASDQSAMQFATIQQQSKNQMDISLAAINAQTTIAVKPKNCGLLGMIFGC